MRTPGQPAEAVLARMTDAIRHRGPDDSGFYHDDFAHLGHRRLSIIDLATGQQPMCNETRTLWIVYNGEIFNHASIRPELERAGHRYASVSDTETILHSYEEYGPACLNRYRGMFAFALWDSQRRQLFAARDRLGIKPFYYYWDGRLFAFASEIKALLEHPGISPQLEESLLSEYLAFGYSSGKKTLFRNIRKLMPGHWLTLSGVGGANPGLHIESYWDVPTRAARPQTGSDADWIGQTRRLLEESVRLRLMSDVPLGMFLSGGVDSSAIAAMIRDQVPGGPVKTFSVGYAEAPYSELRYAAEAARFIGTDHHDVTLSMEQFFDALPRLIWHEDEPIAWPSSVSLHFVARLASQYVKVVLTGEGADELFGGYERYRWNVLNQRGASVYRMAPAALRRKIRSLVETSPLLRASIRRKLSHTWLGREDTLESLYLDNFYAAFSQQERRQLLPHVPDTAYHNYRHYWDLRAHSAMLEQMLYADQKTYLVELLMKQDQMSMASSLESRVPFLDHQFVEFSTTIPDRLKIRGKQQKYILKKAVEDLIPKEVVYRRKMGFPTPLRQWLREPRSEALLQALTRKDGLLAAYLDRKAVETHLDRHRNGSLDATEQIWRLLNLQIWGDIFLTGKRDRWLSRRAWEWTELPAV